MLNKLFKSIVDQDRAPIVICDKNSVVVYMNPAANACYGRNLSGINIKECHNADSAIKIDKVVEWFASDADNNIMYTYHDNDQNKDIYMVALRDECGALIGYYEKHEYRDTEKSKVYDF